VGPFCYHVRDAVQLRTPVSGAGNLGFFVVPQEVLHNIMTLPEVHAKVVGWRTKYAVMLRARSALRALCRHAPAGPTCAA